MSRRPVPATIKDVARSAGVSVATVSRALNGASNVLPDTRAKVMEAARRLRFSPSGAARSLIMRRTDTVGALLPDLHGEYFSELIRGIDLAARARGLHLLVSSSHGDADEAAAALRAMSGRVDGVLLMSPHADAEFVTGTLPANLPAVLLSAGTEPSGLPRYAIDNDGGARAMTRHLIAAGRRRLAFIAGPADNLDAAQRLRGYRAELRPEMAEAVFAGDFSEESGWRAGRRIAAARPRPDAVFAANDLMAIGCLQALREAGLDLPSDVAIGGFDDILIARYLSPPLTTIRVPIAALGAAALTALVAELARGDVPAGPAAPVVLPVELVVRRSCGADPPPPATSERAPGH